MPNNVSKSTNSRGFGNFQQKQTSNIETPLNQQNAEQAKAIAQQTAQGLEQYLGHTGIDVLNQVRGAKHQITDAVSTAVAAELVPARIQAEVLTASLGKLQTLDPSSTKGFKWEHVPDLPPVASLPVVDISHLFPASTQNNQSKALQASQQDLSKGLDDNPNS